jgi:capsular exopolysaccharide synthesis family protein
MNQEQILNEQENGLNLEQYGLLFLSKWYWFVLSVLVAMACGIYYYMQSTPMYTRSAQLLIKSEESGATASALKEFKDLGIVSSSSNISNEILTISAPVMMEEVVKNLNLDLQMKMDNGFYISPLYNDAPILLQFPAALPKDLTFSFKMNIESASSAVLYDFVVSEKENILTDRVKIALNGVETKTPVGNIKITKSPSWDDGFVGKEILITKSPIQSVARAYSGRLNVSLVDKESTVLSLSLVDESPDRADAILMELINVYDKKWIDDNNKIAISTSKFISERLDSITKELGHVDERISDYKSQNLIPDAAASLAKDMQQSGRNYERLMDLRNHLAMTTYVRDYLSVSENDGQLLPSNVGIPSSGIESMIAEYNKIVLERMAYLDNTSEENSVVRDLDRRLASQKTAILRSVDNLLVQLNQQISAVENSEKEIIGNIAEKPLKVKNLLSDERQQKVKESLYIFLLQKREETELSRTFTASNTSVIQPPVGSSSPSSPRKNMILLVSFVIGALLPAALIYLREILNKTVRGRVDLEGMKTPFIGEIPFLDNKKHWWQRSKNGKRRVVVKDGCRDYINESFRLVRSKLDYFIADSEQNKVIMMTSFNPGSGKTFITANLGTTFALKDKKVLIIDMDIRRCALSEMVGSSDFALTSYLNGQIDSIDEVVVKNALGQNVDVLPVGVVPPNPTEILMSDSMDRLFEEVRGKYDYIFLDTAPIEIVADADIVKKYADATLFIVREGVMDRRTLPKVDELYDEGTYKKFGIILNGTKIVSGKYGRYRYGYTYGFDNGNIHGYHEKS